MKYNILKKKYSKSSFIKVTFWLSAIYLNSGKELFQMSTLKKNNHTTNHSLLNVKKKTLYWWY